MSLPEFFKFVSDFREEVGRSHGRLLEAFWGIFSTTKSVEEAVLRLTQDLTARGPLVEKRLEHLTHQVASLHQNVHHTVQQATGQLTALDGIVRRLDTLEAVVSALNLLGPTNSVAKDRSIELAERLSVLEAKLDLLLDRRVPGHPTTLLPSPEYTDQTEDAVRVAEELAERFCAHGIPSATSAGLAAQVVVAVTLGQAVSFLGGRAEELATFTAHELVGSGQVFVGSSGALATGFGIVVDLGQDMLGPPPAHCAHFRALAAPAGSDLTEAVRRGLVIVTDSLPSYAPLRTTPYPICKEGFRFKLPIARSVGEQPDDAVNVTAFLVAKLGESGFPEPTATLQALRALGTGLPDLDPSAAWTTGWIFPIAKAYGIDVEKQAHIFVTGLPRGLLNDPRVYWMTTNFLPTTQVLH